MIFQSAGASSDLDQEQADIPPWMMDACPYSHSDATYELVKFIPKLVPLDHPDYDAMVPKQAVGKINLYCAHPGNDTIFREKIYEIITIKKLFKRIDPGRRQGV